MSILLVDNYDSFTFNLYDYVAQQGVNCVVKKNDAITLSEVENYDAIILSPGPKTPATAGITIDIIQSFFDKKPILGVCLGHQAIGQVFGAKLVKAIRPMHGHTSQINLVSHPLFTDMPAQIEVMRYHSLILENVQPPLRVIASTMLGEVMAVAHENDLLVGIQFHPESILTPWGLKMIENWVRGTM